MYTKKIKQKYKFEPNHPASILRREIEKKFKDSHKNSDRYYAQQIGVNQAYLCNCLNGSKPISAKMAIDLEKAGIKTALFWVTVREKWLKQYKPSSLGWRTPSNKTTKP